VDFNDPLKIGIGEICSGYFSFKLIADIRIGYLTMSVWLEADIS